MMVNCIQVKKGIGANVGLGCSGFTPSSRPAPLAPVISHTPPQPQLVEFYDEMQNHRLTVQVSVTKELSQQASNFPPILLA